MNRVILFLVLSSSTLSAAADRPVKRDPFRSPFLESNPAPKKPEAPCRATSCLLDETDLQLVGIVTGTADPTAMVQDRTGRGFVLRRNSPVGANGARVERIDGGCVHVVRYVLGADGRSEQVTSQLCVNAADRPGGDLDYVSGEVR
ncbi:MAG: hypothetical protein AMXMBFR34_51440 [Myxococcaceae bacterium]